MARPLALCHYSMIEVEPPDLVELAAGAGFSAVSLMLHFPPTRGTDFPIHGDTPMRRETKRRLDDTGVVFFDASTCRLEPDSVMEEFLPTIETAAYLGATCVNVNGNDPDEGRLTDRFAALCAAGAEHGLRAGIEFMMSTFVRTLADARRLIERSGATNAAITVDALHLARSGGSPADVAALDPALISYVQLCDGPAEPPPEGYLWEAGRERRLPGDGDLPLRALVDAVAADVLLGVEVPSARRREEGVSADEHAAQAMRSLRRLLDGT